MDALQELRAELYATAAEQFVKEYQNALDFVRRNLAIYVDPCAMSALTNHPQPISDDYTTGERVVELGIRHDQQLVEVEHILSFMLDNYLTRPGVGNAEQIAFALERFLNSLQRATDSYTVKLGISPYQNRSPYGDSMMVMMQRFQQLHLRAADCGTGGEGGRGATEIV